MRAAGESDREAIVALARSALGWEAGDRPAEFFSWKHDQNPFGPSPMWVAEDDGDVVGFRTFLRWEFVDGDGVCASGAGGRHGHPPRPPGQGHLHPPHAAAPRRVEAEGVDFVFNTPNDKSRPGYLKMGWEQLGPGPDSSAALGACRDGRHGPGP